MTWNDRSSCGPSLRSGPGRRLPYWKPAPPRDLLVDEGFSGWAFAAAQATRSTAVLVPPGKRQRAAMPSILLKVISKWRNRIETTFSEFTDRMELARHASAPWLRSARRRRC